MRAPGKGRSVVGVAGLAALLALLLSATAVAQPGRGRGPRILLYEHQYFEGESRMVDRPMSNLRSLDFNDRVSSLVVLSGVWEVCLAKDYRECRTFDARGGRVNDLRRYRLNDDISSVRPVGGSGRPPVPGPGPGRGYGRGEIVLYRDNDFRGERRPVRAAVPNLEPIGWNDSASSLQVVSGRWEVCRAKDYRECIVLTPRNGRIGGLYRMGLNDEISSLRPLR